MLSSSPIRGGQALLAPNTAYIGKRLRHSKTGALYQKSCDNEKESCRWKRWGIFPPSPYNVILYGRSQTY
jgi:hypothetical protein